MLDMLLGIEAHFHDLAQAQVENVLTVAMHVRGILLPPGRQDLVLVDDPVSSRLASPNSPVSSNSSRRAAPSGLSPHSSEPVTDCQKSGGSRRRISSTSLASVVTTTRTDSGRFMRRETSDERRKTTADAAPA